MLGFMIYLLAGVTLARANSSPPYVQSREAFTSVKTYLSEALHPGTGDINTHEGRRHLSFGILAGSVAGLVVANRSARDFNPLLVLDKHIPYDWSHFDEVAVRAQSLLNEASGKIHLMEDLINNICDAESVVQCNARIHDKVLGNPNVYKLPSELLLLLGKASDTIRRHQLKINSVTNMRTEIPYLINSALKPEVIAFVAQLDEAYKKMRQLQYRRFNVPQFGLY